MLSDDTLRLIRCPEDHSALTLASEQLTAALNEAIAAQHLHNQTGQLVDKPLDGGLVRAAGDLLYPIVNQIPVMLVDEAIRLDQLSLRNSVH